MLEFNGAWRFESPSSIPSSVIYDLSALIGKITTQGDSQAILERFKSYFAGAAGTTSSWSSSTSWAESDLHTYMQEAASNAPLFIEAFYDACESLRKEDIAVPAVKIINRVLAKHDTGYEIQPPNLVSHNVEGRPVEVAGESPSLERQAREIIQNSLSQSEHFLSEGREGWPDIDRDRQALQELLWLLETVSTAFQGLDTGRGAVQGKYFNKIVEDLRKHSQGTTLNQVLDWITTLPRLFCNLIRSYISFLIAEHERLTGGTQVLDS